MLARRQYVVHVMDASISNFMTVERPKQGSIRHGNQARPSVGRKPQPCVDGSLDLTNKYLWHTAVVNIVFIWSFRARGLRSTTRRRRTRRWLITCATNIICASPSRGVLFLTTAAHWGNAIAFYLLGATGLAGNTNFQSLHPWRAYLLGLWTCRRHGAVTYRIAADYRH